MDSPSVPSLQLYLDRVGDRVAHLVHSPELHPTHQQQLSKVVQLQRTRSAGNPLTDPVALPYLVARAWGREADEQVQCIGAFCLFFLLSLDLFDDVQDDDLAGKPHATVGVPLAVNDALTLLFLGLRAMHRAIELEADVCRRIEYFVVFDRVSTLAVGAQHCDLAGLHRSGTRAEVLAMQQAKTSSVGLFMELGALLAGCEASQRALYRKAGECLTLLVQISDDLRDVFGKNASPDITNGTSTYPLACLRDCGDMKAERRFEKLRGELPASLPAIRELFYDSGAVELSAEAMERYRQEVHRLLAATSNQSGYHRLLLEIADGVASTVFEPPPLESSCMLWSPTHGWHSLVRNELALFLERMRPYAPPAVPQLRTWHFPQWMYLTEGNVIFYPDLEDLRDEILPFQQALLGTSDPSEVERFVHLQLPLLVAHEMFHCWRHASGRMTKDHWHEEWAANRLALAYAREHCPDRVTTIREVALRVLVQKGDLLDQFALSTLGSCHEDRSSLRPGYGMGLHAMAVTTLEMVRRLSEEQTGLVLVFDELLGTSRRTPNVAA